MEISVTHNRNGAPKDKIDATLLGKIVFVRFLELPLQTFDRRDSYACKYRIDEEGSRPLGTGLGWKFDSVHGEQVIHAVLQT